MEKGSPERTIRFSTDSLSTKSSPLRRSLGYALVDPSSPFSSGVRLRSDISVSLDSSDTIINSPSTSLRQSKFSSYSDNDESSEPTVRFINYTTNQDIIIILYELRNAPVFGIITVAELAEAYLEVLQTLTHVYCNKVAAQLLGSRLEDSIQILGDVDIGLLTDKVALPSQIGLISMHAIKLTRNLGQVASYLRRQGSAGWLRHSFRLEGSAPLQYKILDDGLLACVNALVLALGGSGHLLLLRPVSYSRLAVDVKRIAESLGTISEIHDSPAKLMQLAHAIQASPLHLHTELALILQGKYSGRFIQDDRRKLLYTSDTFEVSTTIHDRDSQNITDKNNTTTGAITNYSRKQISDKQVNPRKWNLLSAIYNFFQI